MKKVLALVMALLMAFACTACNPEPAEENNPAGGGTGGNTAFGMGIKDVDALLALLAGGDTGIDLKNLKFEMMASESGNALLSMGAKLGNKNYDAKIFIGEAIVLSAPALLDGVNYGIKGEDIVSMLTSMLASAGGSETIRSNKDPYLNPADQVLPGDSIVVKPEQGASTAATMIQTIVKNLPQYKDRIVKLAEKYVDEFAKQMTTNAGLLWDETTGVLQGTLYPDNTANVIAEMIEFMSNDDELFALLSEFGGPTKEDFNQGKPSKADIKEQVRRELAAVSFQAELVNLTVKNGAPVALDVTVSMNVEGQTAAITMAYNTTAMTMYAATTLNGQKMMEMSMDKNGIRYYLDLNGQKLEAQMTMSESSIVGELKVNNQVLASLNVQITSDKITADINIEGTSAKLEITNTASSVGGTLTLNGQKMGELLIDKKVEGSKTTLTVNKLEIQGAVLDFSNIGLSFWVDTNATMPATPSYKNAATLTENDLMQIVQKFSQDNAELVALLQMFVGGGQQQYA